MAHLDLTSLLVRHWRLIYSHVRLLIHAGLRLLKLAELLAGWLRVITGREKAAFDGAGGRERS